MGHPGSCGAYTKSSNVAWQFPAIAGVVKNVVSWGANMLTTVNSASWSYIRAFEKLKERGGRAWFIGPELTDTGVTCHTDWIQSRNYTDVALIMGMLYEMLVNTFSKNGEIQKSSKALDIDYIDTMVHGFFASPEYYVNTTTGDIVKDDPSDPINYRHIEAVEAGKCLASYILGGDASIIGNPTYNANSTNYTATKYNEISNNMPRVGAVSWTVTKGAETEYQYKKDFSVPKTPEWAEKITGVPAEKIRELANMYTDPEQHPIFNEWAGGTQKQLNGSIQLWAITALMAITKTFGLSGETFGGAWAATNSLGPVADAESNNYIDFSLINVGNAGVTTISDRTVNSISCKEWFNGIKIAYKDYLTPERGYTGENIPDWDMSKRYYSNDGGVKSLVMFERDSSNPDQLQTEQIDGKTYYKVKRDANGNPIYSGIRMILNAGGAIMVNQHMNSNDLTAMYRAIPALNSEEGGGYNNPDSLCLVTFDLFMSPTARYMDYVLPAVSQLEAVGREAFGGQSKQMYRPPVVEPLGDALDSWTMTYKAWVAQSGLGEISYGGKTTTGISDAPNKYTNNSSFKPIRNYFDAEVDKATADPASKYYGMTRDEVYGAQFTPAKNNDEYICTSLYETKGTTTSWFRNDSDTSQGNRNNISQVGQIRKNLDEYLEGNMAGPFVFTTSNSVQNKFDGSTYSSAANNAVSLIDTSSRPAMSGKFQIYNGRVKWDYEHAFEKYHGWLPAENRGQENRDAEGDLKVYPIPIYFNFEDCFKESYNGFEKVNSATGEAKTGPNAAFFAGTGRDKPLTMSTTHDRFRVHSTHDENPLLRELNHRTINGGWASGNDWKEYCIVPERQTINSAAAYESPMISSAIYNKNRETASWHEIWINTQDAAERGITDGMLCRVENPIGKVRVIARVTDRCIPGHLNLHQGGWYDPNTDGVDDGGNANTLIASTPSRYDHGNAQQSAYVTIKPETEFNI
ncbi:MAG: molybdopterin-dependent oxidoreductase [Mucispirillum sp.]|nr:molybdopterin-dependent oxidoreductase [Mucispirillum sp.]